MEKMKRMQSKKSHSWWWDSHISRRNSKWLAESLAEMDQSVKQMLRLIEEDGDSFAKKAEMYYAKRPELVSHVENFYRMYRALAERYDQVTGDIRKKIKTELKSHNSPAGFDLTSTGSSDHSKKQSDDSSSSSSGSDSDSDESEANINGDSSELLQHRILELENELSEVKEKLKIQEDKCQNEHSSYVENGNNLDLKAKVFELEEQLSDADDKLKSSEAQISALQKKLNENSTYLESENAELYLEKEKAYRLQEQVVVLHHEISGHKREIEQLKGAAKAATTELHFATEKHLQEKSVFETRIVDLEDLNAVLNAEVDKYAKETLSLRERIAELEHVVRDLKATSSRNMEILTQEKSALEANISVLFQSKTSLEAEVTTLILTTEAQAKFVKELNEKIDALKLNIDELTAEKVELTAKLSALLNDLKSRDDKISQADRHLNELHLQHVKMITEIEASRRSNSELRARVKELEEEVEEQKAAVYDSVERKREAIRQLCFSLEHYRDGYNELRQLLQGHKRSAIMAS